MDWSEYLVMVTKVQSEKSYHLVSISAVNLNVLLLAFDRVYDFCLKSNIIGLLPHQALLLDPLVYFDSLLISFNHLSLILFYLSGLWHQQTKHATEACVGDWPMLL